MNNLRIFLYKLLHKNTLTLNGKLTDNELSLIIKEYIKHYKVHLLECKHIINIIIDYPLSCIVVYNFNKLYLKKIKLLLTINKWHTHYTNDLFWELLSYEQINYLFKLKDRFNSIFDCAKCKELFNYKISILFANKNTNYEYIISQVIERLMCILDIFNQDIFVSLQIPLITVKDFYELPHANIIQYMIIIYKKITKLINTLIRLFNLYNLTCIKLNTLINSIPISKLLCINTIYYLN
jgi:hypothetical protein